MIVKRIKKIPVILATLTLATAGVEGALPTKALSGVPQDIIATAVETGNSFKVETNLANAPLRLDTIRYKTGTNQMSVTAPGDDWYIKKVIVAYMNYSMGITEEEADQNLATLNNSQDDNWKVLSFYEVYPWSAKKTQDIAFNKALTDKNAYTNKSDIFYYAIEFGKIVDDGWTDTMWSRGKIDYRSCVHSSVFDEETMSCARVEDGETIKYVPKVNADNTLVALPENEKVMTWVEEWKDVISDEAKVTQYEVEQMEEYLKNGLEILDRNDALVDGIYKSWMYYVENQPSDPNWSRFVWAADGAQILKLKIAEMRKFFEADEPDTTVQEVLVQENTALKQEIIVLKEENTTLESQKAVLEQENEALKGEKAELEKEILRLREEKSDSDLADNDLEKDNTQMKNELKDLKQELENMTNKVTELQQKIDVLELNKREGEEKSSELQQEIYKLENEKKGIEAEKNELRERITELEKSQAQAQMSINNTPEVAVIASEANENEEVIDSKTEEVDVPVLGGEEVKTSGLWWWLIPVVGLAGVAILLVKRKISRE